MNSAQRHVRSIRDQLTRRGISQVTAAQRMGVSQQYLSRRLTGRVPLSLEDFLALASLLELDLELADAPASKVDA